MSKPRFANGSNKHQLIVGSVGVIMPGPLLIVKPKKASLPAFPPTSETTRQDGCNLQCVIFVYSGKMI